MCTRRQVLVAPLALAASTIIRSAWSSEVPQPPKDNEKAVFIVDAMKQAKAELLALEKAAEKRGELSSFAPPPALIPFGDWDFYYVRDFPLVWMPNPGQKYAKVSVPIGFVTDLTSIPRIFWSVLPREGRYAYAAVVHDYLYWTQDRSRAEADDILRIGMEDSKVDRARITSIYTAVRNAGGLAWTKNQELKAKGEKRVLKKFPTDFTTSWLEWKKSAEVFAP